MIDLLLAMALIGAAWVVVFLVFLGIGSLARQIFRLAFEDAQQILDTFWLGMAFASALLLAWHLQFRIDWKPLVILSAVGLVGLLWTMPSLLRLIRRSWRPVLLLLVVLLLAGVWVSNRANDTPEFYDAGLYHFQSIQWANEYPAVRGLGNLHGRLAFNSSYHLVLAALNTGPLADRAFHVGTSLLMMVVLASICTSAYRLLRRPHQMTWSDGLNVLFLPAVMEVFLGNTLFSPETDTPVFLLGLALARQFVAFAERPSAGRSAHYNLFVMGALAALGITIKLSFAVFGITLVLVAFVKWLVKQPRPAFFRQLLVSGALIVAPVALLLVPWMLRGLILSGYPAYPSTLGAVSVDWRVPAPAADEEANWIKSWARQPEAHWSDVLGNWRWLKSWAKRYVKLDGVRIPLILAAVSALLVLYRGVERRALPGTGVSGLLLIPAALALGYWFLVAPGYRFAGAAFWIMGAAALITALSAYGQSKGTALGLISVALGLSLLYPVEDLKIVGPGPDGGFHPSPGANVEPFETDSGLVITYPIASDRCWNMPLLCTPYPNPALEQRRSGDLGAGFRVAP